MGWPSWVKNWNSHGYNPELVREAHGSDSDSYASSQYEKTSGTSPKLPTRRTWAYLVTSILALVSLGLIIVSITAGRSPGLLEDYHVVYFNTSTLGKNLLDDKKLKLRSEPMMPMITEAPTVVHRFHGNNEKRFGVGDVIGGATSVAGDAASVGGDVTSVGGDAVSAASSVATEAATAVKSGVDAAQSGLEHLVDEAKDALEDIIDDLADELYKKLGIQQFYSIHLTDMCYGNFTPNATADGAGFGVVNCTQPLNWTQAVDLTGMLNQSLGVGPFQLDLGDIGMVQDVVETIDKVMKILNSCLEAILAMYIIAAVFTGVFTAISLVSFFQLAGKEYVNPQTGRVEVGSSFPAGQDRKRVLLVLGFFAAWAGTLFLLAGNLVTTLGGKYGVDQVREHGEDFGLYAYRGVKFLAVTWSAFGLVAISAAVWTWRCIITAMYRYEKSGGKSWLRSPSIIARREEQGYQRSV